MLKRRLCGPGHCLLKLAARYRYELDDRARGCGIKKIPTKAEAQIRSVPFHFDLVLNIDASRPGAVTIGIAVIQERGVEDWPAIVGRLRLILQHI